MPAPNKRLSLKANFLAISKRNAATAYNYFSLIMKSRVLKEMSTRDLNGIKKDTWDLRRVQGIAVASGCTGIKSPEQLNYKRKEIDKK
jgi:hypothetical protein